jgi:molecular chaperone HscB
VRCPSCDAAIDVDGSVVCASCQAIVPVHPHASVFARLGLPATFVQNDSDVERAWLQRSRVVHPDRLSQKTPEQRRRGAEQMAAINDAHRVVRRPIPRAEALLQMANVAVPAAAQDVLMMLMDAREEADEACDDV